MRRPYLLAAFLLLLCTLTWAQDLFDERLTPEGVQAALDAGADLEARTKEGRTALMIAARNNENSEVVQALLDAGADATAKNEEGMAAWDLIQDNESLKDTKAYWWLNDLRWQ